MFPAPDTRCEKDAPKQWADWQRELGDTRYGWLVNERAGGGRRTAGCDWRRAKPHCAWPGAKGAENAGGL